MAAIKKSVKDNPKLLQKELSGGKISLFLEYYLGRTETPILDAAGQPVLYQSGNMAGKPKYSIKHTRKKESLNLYLIAKPRTAAERQQNKETLELAKQIRFEKEQQLLQGNLGYRLKSNQRHINFLDYFQGYIDRYTKKDIRMMQIALQRFKDFLSSSKRYELYAKSIKPEQITKDMMLAFTEYLQSRSVYQTPITWTKKSNWLSYSRIINWG